MFKYNINITFGIDISCAILARFSKTNRQGLTSENCIKNIFDIQHSLYNIL